MYHAPGKRILENQRESLPPSGVDALANLLRDLHRNDVVAVDVLVVEPPVCRSHEVLILHVDEPLRPSDGGRVGAGDRVVHGAALFRRERSLIFQLKPVTHRTVLYCTICSVTAVNLLVCSDTIIGGRSLDCVYFPRDTFFKGRASLAVWWSLERYIVWFFSPPCLPKGWFPRWGFLPKKG